MGPLKTRLSLTRIALTGSRRRKLCSYYNTSEPLFKKVNKYHQANVYQNAFNHKKWQKKMMMKSIRRFTMKVKKKSETFWIQYTIAGERSSELEIERTSWRTRRASRRAVFVLAREGKSRSNKTIDTGHPKCQSAWKRNLQNAYRTKPSQSLKVEKTELKTEENKDHEVQGCVALQSN